MKPEYQKKLEEAFELEYPQLVEFAETHDYVSKIHKETLEEFASGFVAGLEAAGLSEFEIEGTGLAGYMIRLDGENLMSCLDKHLFGLYSSVEEAKLDANSNRPKGDYEIYSVTYKNEGDAPDFKLEYR